MVKPVIAVDFDDVVADFNRAFLAHNNTYFGTNVSYADINVFDLGAVYGIDRQTFVERALHFCHTLHNTIEPIAGARETLQELSQEYKLHIVTSRWDSLEEETGKWLNQWFPDVFSKVHFVNKGTTELSEGKSATCRAIGAVALIDDALHHIIDATENGVVAVLMDRPWNQGQLPDGVVRVNNWTETSAWIRKNIPTP